MVKDFRVIVRKYKGDVYFLGLISGGCSPGFKGLLIEINISAKINSIWGAGHGPIGFP
jgi:hypothetical protein